MNKIRYTILLLFLLNYVGQIMGQPSHDPRLSLPWTVGEKWWLHHGAHTSNGAGPLSSLDFAPTPGASHAVRAARTGKVVPLYGCTGPAQVMLDHGDGYYTSYYHLKDIPNKIRNPVGTQWIYRGEFIGNVETDGDFATPCSIGSWVIPHVHFTLRVGTSSAASSYADLIGEKVGGWEVLDEYGGDERKSGIRKDGYTVRRPSFFNNYAAGAVVYNDGSLGTGDFTTYDLCRDHQMSGVYTASEKIPAWANQDISTNALFLPGADARIMAGRRIVFQDGFRIYAGAKVSLKTTNFVCDNLPQLVDYSEEENVDDHHPEPLGSMETFAVRVNPNPFEHSFSIEWYTEPNAALIGYELVDLGGKSLIRESWLTNDDTYGLKQINLADHISGDLAAGVYIVRLYLENGQHFNHKIVKQ